MSRQRHCKEDRRSDTAIRSYYELQIKINPEIAEVLSEFCFENLECEGVVLAEETYKDLELVDTTEGVLKVFIPRPLPEREEFVSEQVELTNSGEGSTPDVLTEFRQTLKSRGFSNEELGTWETSVREVENQDWSQKWKEKWDVTRVSTSITVVPEWINYEPQPDEIVINLDPGSAFGTGIHPTTQLCMRAIENHMPAGARMADIGTGSGILAICAAKFGASYVYACDNDETVIPVAKENGGKCRSKCVFEVNTADRIVEKFDFICANILHNVLAEITGDLKNLLNPGATMVLSGISDEKKQVVIDAILKYDLEIIEETRQDQWVALLVRRDK